MKPGKPLTRKTPLKSKTALQTYKLRGHTGQGGAPVWDGNHARAPQKVMPKRGMRRNARKHQRPKTPEEQAFLNAVGSLPCDACLQDGVRQRCNVHHIREGYGASQRASHFEVLPECEGHHQGMRDNSKAVAFHRAPRTFQLRYGNEIQALQRTYAALGIPFDRLPVLRGSFPPWWADYLRGKYDNLPPEEIREAITGEPK